MEGGGQGPNLSGGAAVIEPADEKSIEEEDFYVAEADECGLSDQVWSLLRARTDRRVEAANPSGLRHFDGAQCLRSAVANVFRHPEGPGRRTDRFVQPRPDAGYAGFRAWWTHLRQEAIL